MEKIEIFVGTYEEFMLGFKIEQTNKAENKFALKQTLSTRDHSASVRCVASMGKYVATGAADDRAFIYDLKKRSISHIVINHTGTINALAFSPDATHLFAGSDDGSISVTRMGTWVIEKIWKNAHKGSAVKYLSIHPSGKLALSIGSDLVLRTWNLIKGRQAYATNLKNKPSLGKVVENVEWSSDGKNFIVCGAKAVEIMSVDEAKVLLVVECKSKPCAVCWIDSNDVLVGLESGEILHASLLSSDTNLVKLSDTRIKGISVFGHYVAIITSSGDVAVYKLINGKLFEKVCSTNIGCRPTCITLLESVNEELDGDSDPKIVQDQPVEDKKIKINIKPKVVVEIETDYISNKTESTNTSSTETLSKKRQKQKSNKSCTLCMICNTSQTECACEDGSKLKKSKIESNDNFEASHKKSKKKKRNQSLEPEVDTEKMSKKMKRKSVV